MEVLQQKEEKNGKGNLYVIVIRINEMRALGIEIKIICATLLCAKGFLNFNFNERLLTKSILTHEKCNFKV